MRKGEVWCVAIRLSGDWTKKQVQEFVAKRTECEVTQVFNVVEALEKFDPMRKSEGDDV